LKKLSYVEHSHNLIFSITHEVYYKATGF